MEANEVSLHEVQVYLAIKAFGDRWFTNDDLAENVEGVKPRTVRAKTSKLVALGLLDVAEVFPAHRYRWSEKAKQRNGAYLRRLDHALEVFGLKERS